MKTMATNKVVPFEVYELLARTGKALSNPIRLRLLDNLEQGESTVEALAELSEVPLKNTSAQLQQLRAAGLVATRREGTKVFYRIAGGKVSRFLGEMQRFAEETSADLREEISEFFAVAGEFEEVDVETLKRRAEAGEVLIVDTRDRYEYDLGHLPGAISLPAGEITERIDELRMAGAGGGGADGANGATSAAGAAEVVAYCQGPFCLTSPRAVAKLAELGVSAKVVKGGITEWIRQGNALTV